MTGHRLGGTDCNLQGPGSQGALDGRGFVLVVGGGAGAMGVDVVDAVGTDLAVLEGQADGGGSTDTSCVYKCNPKPDAAAWAAVGCVVSGNPTSTMRSDLGNARPALRASVRGSR